MSTATWAVRKKVENAEDARGKQIEAKEAPENMRPMAADLFEKSDLDIC